MATDQERALEKWGYINIPNLKMTVFKSIQTAAFLYFKNFSQTRWLYDILFWNKPQSFQEILIAQLILIHIFWVVPHFVYMVIFKDYFKTKKYNERYPTRMYWIEYFRDLRTALVWAVLEYSMHRMIANNSWNQKQSFLEFLALPEGPTTMQFAAMFTVKMFLMSIPVIIFVGSSFYWVHRACHENAFLWKYVHKEHHESWNVGPLSSGSISVIEVILIYGPFYFLYPFFDLWFLRLIWRGSAQESLDQHLGHGEIPDDYGFFHYIHHSKFNFNYDTEKNLINWDIICGTVWMLPMESNKEQHQNASEQACDCDACIDDAEHLMSAPKKTTTGQAKKEI